MSADGTDTAEDDAHNAFTLPEIDAAALTKLAKLIPMLGGTSDHEKLAALSMIEKQLRSQGLTFTDAGLTLTSFITLLTSAPEPPTIEPPKPAPKQAFDNYGGTFGGQKPNPTSAFRPARTAPQPTPQPAPQPPPPPPPPRPSRPPPQPQKLSWHQSGASQLGAWVYNSTRTMQEYVDKCEQLIQNRKYRNAKEKQFLEGQFFNFTSGITPTPKQADWFHSIADR
jgi:hypothetical protein